MDIAFLRALSSVEKTYEPFCILKKDSSAYIYTNLKETFADINDVPENEFVTGYQNYDSMSGFWCSWNDVKQFSAHDKNIDNNSFSKIEATLNWSSNIDQELYISTCEKMIAEMEKGEYFLANLTRKIETDVDVDPVTVAINSTFDHDCEFRFFYHSPEFSYLSLSPERFISIDNGKILSQPIKGTAETFEELNNNIKDKEENTMIVDLVRADFSRIVEPDSIEVNNLQNISEHPGLVQMSSSISGKISKNLNVKECIKQLMPIASVTGTPKPRVLKKIAEHENFDRGIYCGAIGWVDTKSNECDLSVAIRGIRFNKSKVSIGVGAGITHKSDPRLEFEETELKASRLTQLIEKSLMPATTTIFTSTRVKDEKIFAYRKHLKRIGARSIDFIPKDGRIKITAAEGKSVKTDLTHDEKAFLKFEKVGVALSSMKATRDEVLKYEPRCAYERMFTQGKLCAKEKIDDVLIIKNGEVKESTMCNVFVRYGRSIYTPPLDGTILNGILRQTIFEQFDLFGFELKEKAIKCKELLEADEIILTNSVRGASSVKYIDSLLLDDTKSFAPKEAIAAEYFEELFLNNFEAFTSGE